MIGSLRGTVLEREPSIDKSSAEVLVEVMGVGYRVTVTASTVARFVPEAEIVLYIHHHFWEADQKLFGFVTKDERDAFEGLLGAHKVGPALALAIITTYPPVQLAQVLANDDIEALCGVPGVGKKTAQRLLVDLKSSLVLPVLDRVDGQPIDLTDAGAAGTVLADVREALANLGYSSEEIKKAVGGLSPDGDSDADAGALLKQALRSMAGG